MTAVACGRSGARRVVGLGRVDSESYLSCRDFLLELRRRVPSGVWLVTPDARERLARVVRETLPGAAWQRCAAHLERNVRDRCRRRDVGNVAVAALKAALAERDPAPVRAGYRRACDPLAEVDPGGAGPLEDAGPSAQAYLDFPRGHATWARTNNVQERMNCEVKRRTRAVRAFPSFDSLVRLVGAVCCDQNDA